MRHRTAEVLRRRAHFKALHEGRPPSYLSPHEVEAYRLQWIAQVKNRLHVVPLGTATNFVRNSPSVEDWALPIVCRVGIPLSPSVPPIEAFHLFHRATGPILRQLRDDLPRAIAYRGTYLPISFHSHHPTAPFWTNEWPCQPHRDHEQAYLKRFAADYILVMRGAAPASVEFDPTVDRKNPILYFEPCALVPYTFFIACGREMPLFGKGERLVLRRLSRQEKFPGRAPRPLPAVDLAAWIVGRSWGVAPWETSGTLQAIAEHLLERTPRGPAWYTPLPGLHRRLDAGLLIEDSPSSESSSLTTPSSMTRRLPTDGVASGLLKQASQRYKKMLSSTREAVGARRLLDS